MRWNCWNTKPIDWPRSFERSASSSVVTSTPPTRMTPSLGRSRQPSRPSIVDLPDPEGPTIDTKSPAEIVSDTSRNVWTCTSTP